MGMLTDSMVFFWNPSFSYLDDLQAAITGQELPALQQSVNLEELTDIQVCSDKMCCPPKLTNSTNSVESLEEALGPTTPEDKDVGTSCKVL